MRKTLGRVFWRTADVLGSPFVFMGGVLLRLFRQAGAQRMPLCATVLDRVGVWPIRRHYYEPLFHPADLRASLRTKRRLPGIDLSEARHLDLLSQFNFNEELLALRWNDRLNDDFSLGNIAFESGDAEMLYNLLRYFKPRRLVEIGAGQSTRVARQAFGRNAEENAPCEHVCIEPYENAWLEDLGVGVIRKRVETVEPEVFRALEAGDLLFIDSSHIIRPQGDVLYEYLELLPDLESGVLIHIHDIFTPYDYLDDWIITRRRFWNEQYLVEAMLSNSDRYEIIFACNYFFHENFDAMQARCPYLTKNREPGSLYLRVR
jgi:hypothetical protein